MTSVATNDQLSASMTDPSVDETVAAVLAAHDSPIHFLSGNRRYLIGQTRNGEGIYLIRDANGIVVDLTEEVYEACVAEGAACGLVKPVYHVHARYRHSRFNDAAVRWNQIFSPSKAFTVVGETPIPARVDDVAFTRWLAACGEDGPNSPLPCEDGEAGQDFVRLIEEARANGVLVFDEHFKYHIWGDDGGGETGWGVDVRSLPTHTGVYLTSGWLEVVLSDGDFLSKKERVRFYLDEACRQINRVLGTIVPAVTPLITAEQITE